LAILTSTQWHSPPRIGPSGAGSKATAICQAPRMRGALPAHYTLCAQEATDFGTLRTWQLSGTLPRGIRGGAMSASVGRNDPCPCGSGRKYKQCCSGKMLGVKGRRGWMLGILGLALAAAVAWGVMRSQAPPPAPSAVQTPPPSAAAPSAAPVTGVTPSPTVGTSAPPITGVTAPQPWAYDAATNRHFDPTHGHWHDGPPPPAAARSAAGPAAPPAPAPIPGIATPPPGPTPAPWTYDAQKNQHWNPEHGHWHDGPPPAGAK
jgi:hypothetical protein